MNRLRGILFSILALLISHFVFSQESPLLDFRGEWQLVPNSLEFSPLPSALDTQHLKLEMRCTPKNEGYSLSIEFRGEQVLDGDTIFSIGQEQWNWIEESGEIYKLSSLINTKGDSIVFKSLPSMGKGRLNENGEFDFQEILITENGFTTVRHLKWIKRGELYQESSQLYDEKGEMLRESRWKMEKL